MAELTDRTGRTVYIDENHAGQQASRRLGQRLESAGLSARIVRLPPGHDPNSFFLAGGTAADFTARLQQVQRSCSSL